MMGVHSEWGWCVLGTLRFAKPQLMTAELRVNHLHIDTSELGA